MGPRTAFTVALAATAASAVGLVGGASTGCSEPRPSSTYFERSIAPVLTTTCVRTNTGAGCHVATPKGNAFGNLDLSTYEGLTHRRDLLATYGPYGRPALLAKAVGPFDVQVEAFDGQRVTVRTDLRHTGGSILEPTSGGYLTLRRWIDDGASENNGGAPRGIAAAGRLPCSSLLPSAPSLEEGFDGSADPTTADFPLFRQAAAGVLGTCAAGDCHGAASNALALTCGDTAAGLRWNYFAARSYLGTDPARSELLRRPLAPVQGGSYHEGGVVFSSTDDSRYQALATWAQAHGPFVPPKAAVAAGGEAADDAFAFFAHRVQPALVRKGCFMIQCHAGAQSHDYRLRGGSGGVFSYAATRRNHELSLRQVTVESEDTTGSRLVRKNLFRGDVLEGGTGIAHRGGPLFEDFTGEPARDVLCDRQAYDLENGSLDEVPAYCIVREWLRRERTAHGPSPLRAIVYVQRSLGGGTAGRPQDFDVYTPGADLHVALAQQNAGGDVTVGKDTSVTGGCGLSPASADIRRPAVSWDGTTVAFAARSSEGEPLRIYTMAADGSSCAPHGAINAGAPTANGLLVHNFDPAFGPPRRNADGSPGPAPLVFASTRGNLPGVGGPFSYEGPQRTPADPSKPNANLYVFDDGVTTDPGTLRQLTFLLNLERYPAFMADGRVTFSVEKRSPGFRQIAGRRINLDGGDYHPLFGQRPTLAQDQVTEIAPLADGTFAAIFRPAEAPHGGGTLGIVNRSLGVDFQDLNPGSYPVDPTVLNPASSTSPEPGFFLRSLRFPGSKGAASMSGDLSGVYRSPSPLPSPRLLVSFGGATSLGSFDGDYDVFVMDPVSGAKTKVLGQPGVAEVDAVAVYARVGHGIFASAPDEPNGHTRVVPGVRDAEVTYLSVPVLASLLFQNTPTGRLVEGDLTSMDLYEELPPPLEATSFDGVAGQVHSDAFGRVYVARRLLGRVPLAADGSARVRVPGGVPLVLALPPTASSQARGLPRIQRESSTFAPGERAHQSFRPDLFDGLCGSCHGAISGRPTDVAVRPDVLSRASQVEAQGTPFVELAGPPEGRGPVQSGPVTP